MSEHCEVNRAHYMASEGWVVYGEYASEVFANSLATITDAHIQAELMRFRFTDAEMTPALQIITTAQRISSVLGHSYHASQNSADEQKKRQIAADKEHRMPFIPYNYTYDPSHRETLAGAEGQELQEPLNNFVSGGKLIYGIRDGLDSVTTLPGNLLYLAGLAANAQGFPPLYISVASVRKAYKTAWFHDLCHDAAKTANGFWKQFSYYEADEIAADDWDTYEAKIGSKLDFVFNQTDDGLEAAFGKQTLAMLEHYLQKRNKRARIYSFTGPEDLSVGCPVRLHEAHFKDTPYDNERLQLLSRYFGKTIEELKQRRERTTIDLGLDATCTLLDRAVALDPTLDLPLR